MLCIMVDCLGGSNCFSVHAKPVACVWVSVKPRKVAARDLHSNFMPGFEEVACRPKVDGVIIYFSQVDERGVLT